jgi:uncharacterized FlaG/YvyC family protein
MTEAIDLICPTPVPATPASAKASSVPSDTPDLRDTQAAVTAIQHTEKTADPASGPGGEKALEDAINERIARLLGSNTRLRIELDKGSGDFVYKSVNKHTGEVEKQWPAQTILNMLAFFRELDGLIFDQKA